MNVLKNIQEQKLFYDGRWKDFGFANRLKLMRCHHILNAIAATKLNEPKIVDLGCGSGWLAAITGIFGPTFAIDFSETAIRLATGKFKYVKFNVTNIFEWDYPAATFDIVISQEVIEHIESLERQKSYLDIAYGLLRPGGYLILTTPNASTFNAMPESQHLTWSSQPVENWLTIEALRTILVQRFEIIKLTTIIPGYGRKGLYRIINSYRLKKLVERLFLNEIYEFICLIFGFGLHIFAIARKKPKENYL